MLLLSPPKRSTPEGVAAMAWATRADGVVVGNSWDQVPVAVLNSQVSPKVLLLFTPPKRSTPEGVVAMA